MTRYFQQKKKMYHLQHDKADKEFPTDLKDGFADSYKIMKN